MNLWRYEKGILGLIVDPSMSVLLLIYLKVGMYFLMDNWFGSGTVEVSSLE